MIFARYTNPLFVPFSDLDSEVPGLHEGADGVIELVWAQGANQEERVLDVLNQVRQAIHHGACRGSAGALAFVRFLGYELRDIVIY